MDYAIVDIETTGSYAAGNSITEIAIIIHDGSKTLKKFQTLINPEISIPYHIQALTGINDDMVANSPTFKQLASTIFNLLHNKIFVAHNVNFDYSFIQKELKVAGYDLHVSKLCTVRLARKIIPNQASYSLGKLCQTLGIAIHARHRAMGDAEATAILFEKLIKEDTYDIIGSTLKNTREQRLPTHINEEDYKILPEKPGVYLFRNNKNAIIYIGKAINIKKRVFGHFTGNNTSLKRQQFINEIHRIDSIESGTELVALLLECTMIQQHWPKYNKALKQFEPKFGLMYYEDQRGYIRLMISPFNKHANVIQYFERAQDGNKLLLDLIESYNLNPKLCSFYSEHDHIKTPINYDTLTPVEAYNEQVNLALETVQKAKYSFVILDQGRDLDEKSYIYLKEGHVYAFGFISSQNQIQEIEDLIHETDKCKSNYYMTSLVLQYAERFPTKVIRI